MNSSSQEKSYPVLLTQKATGDLVLWAWNNPQAFSNLDPFHTGLLIISAMLLNPEDGKEDNFILSPDGKYLIPIDNDHCFLPGTFQKEGNFWNAFTVNTALQTKTLLFCLDEMMKPVPLRVKQQILSIDFDLLLTEWMTELVKIEDKYNNLIDQDQRSRFLKHGTIMRNPFYPQFIHNLHWKAHKIQDILKTGAEATPFDLLKAVEPFAARCYRDSFQQGNILQRRFKAATNKLYTKTEANGSRVSILNTQSMMEIINASEEDLLNDAMFQKMGPLDVLELLKELIQDRVRRGPTEQDLLCNLDDKNEEKNCINIFGDPSVERSLQDFLENQKEGLILKGSKLITSSKLTQLFLQIPHRGTRIRFLSLPDSPLLDSKEIKTLAEYCPNLEYLNITGCVRLKEIILGKEEWPLLVRLEAKDCLSLEKFISSSPMKILRIGSAGKIEVLVEKSDIDLFTISMKEKPFELSFQKGRNFGIKYLGKVMSQHDFLLSIIQNKEEIQKYFRDWKITIGDYSVSSENDLDFSINCIKLRYANIQTEDMKRMVSLKLIDLERLELSGNEVLEANNIHDLVQGNWPKLNRLDLSYNKINHEALEILFQGNWPLLEVLHLQCTKMTAMGVEAVVNKLKLPHLKDLDLSYNNLQDEGLAILSRGNWPFLEILSLEGMEVTSRALSNFLLNSDWPNFKKMTPPRCKNMVDANIAHSLIQKDLSIMGKLELNNFHIELSQIEIIIQRNRNQLPKLKYLNISDSIISLEAISLLTLMNCPMLEELHLENTKTTPQGIQAIINQSNWLRLRYLNLSNNGIFDQGISALSLAEWNLLQELGLKNTKITQKGIETLVNKINLPNLRKLNVSENEIFDKGLETLVSGNWPLFEHLVYYDTKVTKKGNIFLLENFKWSNFRQFEHSLSESFCDYKRDQDQWSLPEILLAIVPMSYNGQHLLVMVLNMIWLNSKEISLFVKQNGLNEEKIMILPRDKLDQLKYIKLSLKVSPIQFTMLPMNLKILDVSNNSLCDENQLEKMLVKNCSCLEDLDMRWTEITTKGIEIFIMRSNWPRLNKLDISDNQIGDRGLELLASAQWPQLAILNLEKTQITAKGIEMLINKSSWPLLEKLNISYNRIEDRGLELLTYGNWRFLKILYGRDIKITKQGTQMINVSGWPELKILDLS